MASSRHSELPTLRITFKQLEERSREIYVRDSSQLTPRGYRDIELPNESINESTRKCREVQSIDRSACTDYQEFQIKPTISKLDTSTSHGGLQDASEGQRSIDWSSRGRGYKRSRGGSVSSNMGKFPDTSSEVSVISDRGSSVRPVVSLRGRSRGGGEGRVTGLKGTKEDFVSVWKSYCNGRIERAMGTWSVTGGLAKFEETVRTV